VDDFHSNSGTLGIDYQSAAGNSVGWNYRRQDATFPGIVLLNGEPFDRDYTERAATFNLKYAPTAKTALKGSAGYLHREYPRGSIGDFSGDVWNASLDWLPGTKLHVTMSEWRELKAYLDAQSDHFVSRGRSVTCAWTPTNRVSVSFEVSSEDQDYLGTSSVVVFGPRRTDRIKAGETTLSYMSMRHWSFEVSYRLERRDSNQTLFNYDDELLRAGFGLQF